ncbi:hypothetical protein GC173_18770 [bacterium]|nr:hypothetical protein [bacterium]
MPAMLLFAVKPFKLEARELSSAIKDSFALTSFPWDKGQKAKNFPPATDEGQSATFFIDLPELEEDEGDPIIEIEVTSRLDRDEEMQKMIDEIVGQEKSLAPRIDKNHSDILLTFEDTPAAFEVACMTAYAIAEATESGVLVPAFEEGEETLWFDNAEDFADEIFHDEEGEEDGELEDEDDDQR